MKVELLVNLKTSKGIFPAGIYDDASGEIPKVLLDELEHGSKSVRDISDKAPEKAKVVVEKASPKAGETVDPVGGEQPSKATKTPAKAQQAKAPAVKTKTEVQAKPQSGSKRKRTRSGKKK